MAIPRNSLGAFLRQAKATLKTAIDKKQKVTLVIGNESADLDSITSSIIYAYLKSITQPTHSAPTLHIPLLNIPAADISLRPELLALLPHANIQEDHLITLDDLPDLSSINHSLLPETTRWILVDHNALQGKLGQIYGTHVVGVIDHHTDEHKVPAETGKEPRIIETSGSCTSLIINYCRSAWDDLSLNTSTTAANAQGDSVQNDSATTTLWDAQVAQFALASILIDTNNLLDTHKTTAHDNLATTYLLAKITQCQKLFTDFDSTAFFHKINEAKRDLSSLTVEEILRKDYKQWTENGLTLGTSAVVQPLSFLVSKLCNDQNDKEPSSSLLDAAKAFAASRDLCIFSIMTAYESETGEFARQVAVLAVDDKGFAACKKFAEDGKEKLELGEEDKEESKGLWWRVWRQGNLGASRKQVAPLLREAMKG
ncbi:DHH phosphoesterase [Aureobasidium sp. EXF-10727]|nr:DHH phosphoesterase [Aureobasidium sp. EXF-10727]KAI4725305.1 DHH phosphoesterase [Aureobasidium sp. EXF-10728]